MPTNPALGAAAIATGFSAQSPHTHRIWGVEMVSGRSISDPGFSKLEAPLDGIHGGERTHRAVSIAKPLGCYAVCRVGIAGTPAWKRMDTVKGTRQDVLSLSVGVGSLRRDGGESNTSCSRSRHMTRDGEAV